MGMQSVYEVGTSQDDVSDTVKNERPADSAVFTLANGEKTRLSFDPIASYRSQGKDKTVVQYGYSYDNQDTMILDIDFDSFDAILTQYKKAIQDYWNCYY